MPWIEAKNEGSITRDRDTRGRAARTFKVWGTSRDAIALAPQAVAKSPTDPTGLPAYNAQHPTLKNLRVDSYDVNPQGSVYIATAYYSNSGIFTFKAPINPTAPSFYSWSLSSEKVVKELPYVKQGNQLIAVIGSGGPGSPPAYSPIRPWELRKRPVLHRFGRVTLRVSLQDFDNADRKKIEGQYDTIHQLPGDTGPAGEVQPWLLEGADVVQLDVDPPGWSVEYTWIRDPGSPVFTDFSGNIPPGYPTPDWLFGGKYYVRPPYCELSYIDHPTDPTILGTWEANITYRIELDGWTGLPGLGGP